jgi:hypothetical protein
MPPNHTGRAIHPTSSAVSLETSGTADIPRHTIRPPALVTAPEIMLMSNPFATPQVARTRLRAGRARFDVKVAVSPVGLLAIGGLVAAILLSVPPIIRAAAEARRAGD